MSASLNPDPAIVLAGGAELAVTSLAGESSPVKVRLLRVSEYRDFIGLIDDAERLAEFVTGNLPGWAETLQPQSVLDIVEKAMDLNFTSARRWAELRARISHAATGASPGPDAASSPSRPNSAPTPPS